MFDHPAASRLKPAIITDKRISMTRRSKVVTPRRARTYALCAAGLALLSALLLGCGITLSEGSSQTELFKKLTVQGSFVPGGELQLNLNYEQPYVAQIRVQCDLLTLAKATPTPKLNPTATPPDPERTVTPTPVHIPAVEPTPRNRFAVILLQPIGPNVNGGTADEATPVPGGITRKFTAPPEPGRYRVRCYTPDDENNEISRSFRVRAG